MINPGIVMKLMSAKKQFESVHPKFASFFGNMLKQGIDVGSIIEVSIKKPDGSTVAANMKVQPSDLELLDGLKDLVK